MTWRLVYFGTTMYAVPALETLAADDQFEIALVVTQPDRQMGRGRALTAPPVKVAAQRLDLPVYQPETLRTAAARQPLELAQADLFVVAAYGVVFGAKTLAIPALGSVNLHASLLPKYRGASPVAAAILHGDRETGVSLMLMERGLDTGAVIAEQRVEIPAAATTESLTAILAHVGAELVQSRLAEFAAGELPARPQSPTGASFVRPLLKSDGWIDWSETAVAIERQIRAFWPWPRAITSLAGEPLQIHAATVVPVPPGVLSMDPGSIHVDGRTVLAIAGDQALRLDRLQWPGKGVISGAQALNSGRFQSGWRFDSVSAVRTPIVEMISDGFSTSV